MTGLLREQPILYALVPFVVLELVRLRALWWPRVRLPRALGALTGLVVAVQVGVGAWLVPHAPWQGNHHGIERFAWLRTFSISEHLFMEPRGFHGEGWYVLWGWLHLIPGLGPFGPNQVLSVLASLSLLAFARLAGLAPSRAVAVLVLHAWLPMRWRLAPTVSLYVGVEAALCVALALAALYVRVPRASTYRLALAGLFLAMHQHLEMLALAPAILGAFVLTQAPGTLRRIARDPSHRRTTLAALVLLIPRLLHLATFSGQLPGAGVVWAPKLLALGAVAGVVVVGLAVRSLLPRLPPALWRAGVVLVGLAALAESIRRAGTPLPTPFVDALQPVPFGAGRIHAFVWPHATPPAWSLAAALGGLWTVARAPRLAAFLALSSVPLIGLYAGVWDNPTTFLRAGLTALPLLCLAAGVGLSVFAEALGSLTHRRFGWALAGVALVAGPWSRQTTFTHVYPQTQDFHVLDAASTLSGVDVHALLPDDVTPLVDPDVFAVGFQRQHVAEMVPQAAPLSTLLALTDTQAIGRVVVLSGVCAMATPPRDLTRWSDVAVVGRVWRRAQTGTWNIPRLRTDLWPCWASPERARCADAAQPCDVWSCPDPEPLPDRPPPFVDPICQAVRDRFALEPLVEVPLARGNLAEFDAILEPDLHLGVYRVTGPRTAR